MHMISLEEIMIIMDNNPLFLKDKSLKKVFGICLLLVHLLEIMLIVV